MTIHVFGIRHHGPGCARGLRQALEELRPDAIVLEGPEDAADILAFAAREDLKPPVAMLIYDADEPRRSSFYPFAVFSPEWQVLKWAGQNQVPIRWMDLPQTHQLAIRKAEEEELKRRFEEALAREQAADAPATETKAEESAEEGDDPEVVAEPVAADNDETAPAESEEDETTWRTDPIGMLAEAAGYRDRELWWEQQIERRADARNLFAAILEAMRTVRDEVPETSERDLLREAYMRKTIRGVLREGFETVAVVCGAWHAPVLDETAIAGKRENCKVKDDTERLKGLPKIKTVATWIPWTYSRMTYHSGYGAGVESPGWYGHVWDSNDLAPTRWVATAAQLLRKHDLDASSASVIEAVRLADALAAIRDLSAPGLIELNEAILSVLCNGSTSPMRLIRQELEVGNRLGEVPDDVPSVPLAKDLAQRQKSLRMAPSSAIASLALDLRKENDRARSHLLHQLQLLEIPWGNLEGTGSRASTFRESWRVEWKPEFAVGIVEANVWGNTVAQAALARVIHRSQEASDLSQVTPLLDQAILAGLADAVDPLLARIQEMAAVGADVRHLMDSLLPLARVARYGDVRGTQAEHLEPIVQGMFERVLVGLNAACAALDDAAVERMLESVQRTSEALDVLNRQDLQDEWHAAQRRLMSLGVHPRLRGWCCRSLLERQVLTQDELYALARLNLSSANPPAECAAWATGLLQGSGLVLLHQDGVWQVFDRWMSELDAEVFVEMLPLLRRAFSDFSGPERRQMGEKVKHLQAGASRTAPGAAPKSNLPGVDVARARRVLPVLAHILGVTHKPESQ